MEFNKCMRLGDKMLQAKTAQSVTIARVKKQTTKLRH